MEVLFPFHRWGTGTQTKLTTCPKSLKQSTKERGKKDISLNPRSESSWVIPSCWWKELEKKVSNTGLASAGWVRVQRKEAVKCVSVYLEGICTKKNCWVWKAEHFPVWLLQFHFLVMVGTAFLVLNGISKTSKHFITLMAIEVGETPAGRCRDGSWFSKSVCPSFSELFHFILATCFLLPV